MPDSSGDRSRSAWPALLGIAAGAVAAVALSRRTRPPRPEAPVVPPDRIREAEPPRDPRAVAYTRVRYATFAIGEALSLAFLVALDRRGRSVRLREWAARRARPPFVRDSLFAGSILALHSAATIPFSFVSGHLVEHAFGLSRQSSRSWAADAAKGFAVSLLIGAPSTAGLYAIIRRAPRRWWLWGAGASAGFSALMTHLAPILIDPLFFRFRPLGDEELRQRLEELACRAGQPVVGVFEADYSRKTRKSNAYLTGAAGTRRIVLTDTLLQGYTHDEIAVVLAHELGHHHFGHIRQGILLGGIAALGGFALADGVLCRTGSRPGFRGKDDIATLPSLGLCLSLAGLAAAPAVSTLSRHWERQCDRFALEVTADPGALIGVMRKLGQDNLSDPRPPALIEALLYDHPSIHNRILAALEWEAAHGKAETHSTPEHFGERSGPPDACAHR